MQNLVSIITPNYNSKQYINETWLSINYQTYSNWEWLIVDDGSTDGSLCKVFHFASVDPRIKVFERKRLPKGASTCRNLGMQKAKGDYIIFLDADDLLSPKCLENRVLKMNRHPELDCSIFNMSLFKKQLGDSKKIINIVSDPYTDYLAMFLSYILPWPITAPFWKLGFLKKNQIQFSEKYQRLQDPEFHTKILLCHSPNFMVFNDSKVDCYYRQSSSRLKREKISSLSKTIDSIDLYYSEMFFLLAMHKPNYIHYLDDFTINIFHSLLFYTKLPRMSMVIELYREMDNVRKITKISLFKIRLFAILNILGLTFIRGAGVSRLWRILNN